MLPQFQSDDRTFQMMQNQWGAKINPLLANPSLQNLILKDIVLASGSNVINHKLGRKMQGWRIVDRDSAATVYRSAPLNDLTLTLTASAAVTISLEVF